MNAKKKTPCAAFIWDQYRNRQCANAGKHEVCVIEKPWFPEPDSPVKKRTVKLCGVHNSKVHRAYGSIAIGSGTFADDWRHSEIPVRVYASQECPE
jgi:hypothetical protein